MHRKLKKLKRRFQKLFFAEQWSLLLCEPDGRVLKQFLPPKDRHWADPFPVEHEGRYYIFIEQQLKNRDGTLGYVEFYPDLTLSDFRPLLEKNHHLSFPYVFPVSSGDETVWYLVPETHENGSIDLYRASNFPGTWEFHSTLIPGIEAVDTVVFPP